jgi:hypothetical protein
VAKSHESDILHCQIRAPFGDGSNATISKVLVCAIFIKPEFTYAFVIEERGFFIGELILNSFVVLSRSMGN